LFENFSLEKEPYAVSKLFVEVLIFGSNLRERCSQERPPTAPLKLMLVYKHLKIGAAQLLRKKIFEDFCLSLKSLNISLM
jgi:hypothetical protein